MTNGLPSNWVSSEFLYEAHNRLLDELGIIPGAVVLATMAPQRMDALKSEDIVIAQLFEGDFSAKTIMRQYIEPNLLITNSAGANARPLHRKHDDVHIRAVVTQIFLRPR